MPSHKGHLKIDEVALGKTFPRVHHRKDVYAKYLGPSHRRVAHDTLSNIIIALTEYPDDPLLAFASAQLHDTIDFTSTRAKKQVSKWVADAISSMIG